MLDRNLLLYGNNLDFLRDPEEFPTASVDLVYLDPPFNSNVSYNVLFREVTGEPSAAQIKAFDDTWSWDSKAAEALAILMHDGHTPTELAALIRSFHQFLGHSPMLAYLVQMAVRLVHLQRVLKPTGSLYLHCDPTASHYLKLVLDAVFGPSKFRSEIIWKRSSAHSDTKQGRKQHGRIHDVILYYTKGENWTWTPQYTPYDPNYLESEYRHVDSAGRRYKETDPTAAKPGGDTEYEWRVQRGKGKKERWKPDENDEYKNPKSGWEYKVVRPYEGRFWAYSKENLIGFWRAGKLVHRETGMPRIMHFADEMPGVALQDLWTDIPPELGASDLGYPTQKPLALLQRIVASSSGPGDVILDPFCGCGTTIDAVETLNRGEPDSDPRIWIGIDVTHLAINLIKYRLARFDPPPQYSVRGEPLDVAGAGQLFHDDPYQFQFWACGLVGARPAGAKAGSPKKGKKGADRGIDGVRYFADDNTGPKQILVQVKGGKPSVSQVRDFRGTLEREKAALGIFVTLQEPTTAMRREAAAAEVYRSPMDGTTVPRLQLVTIEQLLQGGSTRRPSAVDLPPGAEFDRTFRKAKVHDEGGLFQ